MPFRNSVISAVIATALTGQRIVIDALTGLGSVIEFYSGDTDETEPARIRSDDFLSAEPGLVMQGHELNNQPAGSIFLGADSLAGEAVAQVLGTKVTIIADERFMVFQSPLTAQGVEFANVPEFLLNGDDIVGEWTPFTPTLAHGGGPIAIDTNDSRYWKCGRTVVCTFSFRVAGGPTAAGPLVTITPPIGARPSAAGIPSYGGGMYFDASTGIRHSTSVELLPAGQFYMADFTDNASVGQLLPLGAGDLFRLHVTYESAI